VKFYDTPKPGQKKPFYAIEITCFALFPKTKSIASMTLLFPLPFGPTTAEKLCNIQR